MDQELWLKSIEFHGHECPGLAIGFRACQIAKEALEIETLEEADIACISETEKCPVDAVRFLFGCTEERNLTIKRNGVPAFSFMNHENGMGIRVMFKGIKEELDREEVKRKILQDPWEEFFFFFYLI